MIILQRSSFINTVRIFPLLFIDALPLFTASTVINRSSDNFCQGCCADFLIFSKFLSNTAITSVKTLLLVLENGNYFLCNSLFRNSLYDFTSENTRTFIQVQNGKNQHFSHITQHEKRYYFVFYVNLKKALKYRQIGLFMLY